MLPRDRVLVTLNGVIPDRVPIFARFTEPLIEIFREKTGKNDPEEYYGTDMRLLAFRSSEHIHDFSEYYASEEIPKEAILNEWGTYYVPSSLSSVHGIYKMFHPMKDLHSQEDIATYPFPDMMAPCRHEGLEDEVESLHKKGLAVIGWVGTIFEQAWYLRGMENLLMDFSLNPDFAAALLDRITEIRQAMAARWVKVGVDIVRTADDVGGQEAMIMNPATWRRWLKPRLAKVIESARNIHSEIPVAYHSDGNIEAIIPDLIEIGVTVLEPVQPECMDPAEIKRQYGDKLTLLGTIGAQTTLALGTPDDVKREVKERMDTVGREGGLILAPSSSNWFEADVPWENIEAFFEAVQVCGVYR